MVISLANACIGFTRRAAILSDDILKEAQEAFKECEEAENDNRLAALEDLRFGRLSIQWPDAVKQQRELEGRPCLTSNLLAPAIRQVVNDARQNRPSISVHPVDNEADPETAEVIAGLIRNIEASSNADIAYDTAVDNAVSIGFGYWRINLDYSYDGTDLEAAGMSAFDQDICIKRVANPFSVYGDPWSMEADSSDWNVSFVTEQIKKELFKRKYPGASITNFQSDDWSQCSTPWHDGESVLVAEYWKREAVIKKAVAVDNGEQMVVMYEDEFEKSRDLIMAAGGQVVGQPRPVKTFKVTQYIVNGVEELDRTDWPGKYIPIIPVYGDEVNEEGKRHLRSLIRDAKDEQRMHNYWNTTSTEMVALAPRAPYIGPKGSFVTDAAKWATANSASHAYIEYDRVGDGGAPQRQPFPSAPAAAIQEALRASDAIKNITGIHDASLGIRSNETSGKAIQARQREGDVSTFHFGDNQTRSIRHTGKVIVDLIPKVYSTPRVARIIGVDKKKVETRQINQEYQKGQDSKGNPIMAMHDLSVGRYDITVTAGPSYTTLRQEAASQMIELIRAYPDAAPVIGDLLASNLDWPGADEIAKRLEKMLPPQLKDEETGNIPPEIKGQMQQMAQAIEQLGQELQEAEKKYGLEQQKIDIDREDREERRNIDWFKAMTEAAKADHAADQAEAKFGMEQDRVGLDGMKTAHAASMAEQQMERADVQDEHSRTMDQQRFGLETQQATELPQEEGPTV